VRKEAVRHGAIEEGGNDAAVELSPIPLEQVVAHEFGVYNPSGVNMILDPQAQWVRGRAHHTMFMSLSS
jgi:hypothetical protein